ncbi:MAG TPA: hypothetical protein VMT76_00555 [Puia sp.]|nr:hypothetical protein [Puia sp.]
MKSYNIIIPFLFFAALTGCSKTNHFMNEGVIVGWNYGYCATCGGFYLNSSNDTVKNAGTYYVLNYSASLTETINKLDSAYNHDNKPIYVSVSWQSLHLQDSSFPTNWIHISDIRER